MDERASIQPGLPRLNPTTPYWQVPPSDIADLQSTPILPEHVDFVIIGSGVSGASIAYNILEKRPDANVLLLEARQAASGASGRNGKSSYVQAVF
jgi:FAD dependent oxidoreductase